MCDSLICCLTSNLPPGSSLVVGGCVCRPQLAATVSSPRSGRIMDLLAQAPGMNVYTGNQLNGSASLLHSIHSSETPLHAHIRFCQDVCVVCVSSLMHLGYWSVQLAAAHPTSGCRVRCISPVMPGCRKEYSQTLKCCWRWSLIISQV